MNTDLFNGHLIRVIETLVVIIIYLGLRKLLFKLINDHLSKRLLQHIRGMAMKKVVNTVLLIVCAVVIMFIWGVNQADLAVFVGSLLTIVGVAFFAQWSLLSNVTAAVIIFFNHPIRLNDFIAILEGKDYVIEGRVVDIGLFFVTLETEAGEALTLPNNLFIQKSIKKISRQETEGETPSSDVQ